MEAKRRPVMTAASDEPIYVDFISCGRPWTSTAWRSKLYSSKDLAYWYALGVQHEQERAAGAGYEHALAFGRTAEQVSRDRHGEMTRLFGLCARDLARQMGRTYVDYQGGPVDWETGTPVRAVIV